MLKNLPNLSTPPPSIELFIFDLPDYYAAGDRDMYIVERRSAANVELHDQTVREFLVRMGHSGITFELGHWEDNPFPDESMGINASRVYIAVQTELTQEQAAARCEELMEPARRAREDADRRWTKTLLTE